VKGSGPKGRVTADDVKGWVKQALKSGAPAAGGSALPKVPDVDFAKFGQVEVKPLGRIQKISGPRLQASWLNVPHVWQMDEADITDLEEDSQQAQGRGEQGGREAHAARIHSARVRQGAARIPDGEQLARRVGSESRLEEVRAPRLRG
jgi:pyruvate/2-oxoglutarate dehydrogenase complex dihydrolipoamide acyltransferase (E2) component